MHRHNSAGGTGGLLLILCYLSWSCLRRQGEGGRERMGSGTWATNTAAKLVSLLSLLAAAGAQAPDWLLPESSSAPDFYGVGTSHSVMSTATSSDQGAGRLSVIDPDIVFYGDKVRSIVTGSIYPGRGAVTPQWMCCMTAHVDVSLWERLGQRRGDFQLTCPGSFGPAPPPSSPSP
jgi:hypothetical protein